MQARFRASVAGSGPLHCRSSASRVPLRITIHSSRRRFAARLNSGVGPRGQTFVAVWASAADACRGKLRATASCAATSFPIVPGASRRLADTRAAMSFPHALGASLQSRRLGVQLRQVGRRHHCRRPNNSFKPNLSAARPSRLNSGVGPLGQTFVVVWVSASAPLKGKRHAPELCAAISFPIVPGASRRLTDMCAAMPFPHVVGASLQSRRLGVQFRQAGRRHHCRWPNNSFKPNLSAGAAKSA